MPQGDAPPSLELAPGFKAPVPTDYASMKEYIETALPAESPIMYGMHTNAELSLLTSQVCLFLLLCHCAMHTFTHCNIMMMVSTCISAMVSDVGQQ